jgi:hypothetical protein
MRPEVRNSLIAEVCLTPEQADVYLLVNVEGRMDPAAMAARLGITPGDARRLADSLVGLGGFIEYDQTRYEAMHPRFTAVNMYRRACERRGIPFGRNRAVDSIGVELEQPYEGARTNMAGRGSQ